VLKRRSFVRGLIGLGVGVVLTRPAVFLDETRPRRRWVRPRLVVGGGDVRAAFDISDDGSTWRHASDEPGGAPVRWRADYWDGGSAQTRAVSARLRLCGELLLVNAPHVVMRSWPVEAWLSAVRLHQG
jgi:hypothetical protein